MSVVRDRLFTPEQAAAIDRREGDLLLGANAGSGKTSVLVERFVRSVLEDGLRAGQILAITFTEKAAGELRARIRERFVELGRRDDARDAEAAWISTIHGFCARVLRGHAVAAGLDPAFAVLDESAARALRAEAFDEALARFLGNGSPEPRLPELDLAAAYTPDRLERMVLATHEELRSRGQAHPSLPSMSAPDAEAARAALDAAPAAAIAEIPPAATGAGVEKARRALDACHELLGGLAPGERPAIARLKHGAFKAGASAALKGPACEAYVAALGAYEQTLVDAEAAAALVLIGKLLGCFDDAYSHAKRARSALDFADLELMARDLFAEQPGIADGYRERFARVMVDEFQDTNPLQLDVIDRIASSDLFAVGDEMQSIYSFRHADITVFRERRDRLEAVGAAASLATSFRALPEILAVLDAAFGDNHGPGYVPLRPGRAPAAGDGSPRVELLITDTAAWEDADAEAVTAGLGTAKPQIAAEARLVARRIRELVDAGECRAADVAVLLRAVADMGVFERALEQEGLATLASGGRGWWGRQQVQDLTAYLGALANPRDEEALLSLLASPLAGVSSDGLALLALSRRSDGVTLWEVLERAFCARQDDRLAHTMSRADAERLLRLCPWFQEERSRAPRLGLAELLQRAVQGSGYDLHVLGLPGGRRRLANVHKLMRLASAYEASHGRDLRGFIDHAAAELEADAAEPDAPIDLGDQDAVRLMTIHAAKGLEFGVVVVAELGRQGNTQFPDLLVRDGDVGLRLVTVEGGNHKALGYERIRDRLRDDAIAEERRVMHVAMTRAQERLILSGAACLGDKWPKPGHGAPPLSWIGPELVPGIARLLEGGEPVTQHPRGAGGEAVRVVLNSPATWGQAPPSGSPAAGSSAPGGQLELDLEPPLPAPAEPARDVAAVGALSYSRLSAYAACSYRYYLERVLGLPEQPVPPELAEEAGGVDARLRGTLAHRLLEDLDFAPGAALPSGEQIAALAEEHEAELGPEDVDDLLSLVVAFANGELRARLTSARWVRREHGFAYPLRAGGPLLNGFVDVLARESDGSFLVVDYKSDRVGDDDLAELVERSYAEQRRIYALAALRESRPPAPRVEVAYLFLERPAEPVIATFTQADAPRLEAELQALARGLLDGDYRPAAVPHAGLCASCPGRNGMCSWPPEMTDRRLEGVS